METSVTIYWMALNFRYVPEKGKKGKRREHIPLAEGWPQASSIFHKKISKSVLTKSLKIKGDQRFFFSVSNNLFCCHDYS